MSENYSDHLDTLQEIRSLMERSSRFISLSGLSGVFAGIYALLGAAAAYWYFGVMPFNSQRHYYIQPNIVNRLGIDYVTFCLTLSSIVLVLAVGTGIFFTTRKAKKNGQLIWDSLTRRLLLHLMIPLVTGGIFCLGLLYNGYFGLVAPSTLIFYGLSLVNASKYTLPDVRYLGISEIILGLIAVFFLGYGLDFWAIGFGVLHIIYGARMHWKYDRKSVRVATSV